MSKGKDIVSWQDRMKGDVKKVQENAAPAGNTLSAAGGHFNLGGKLLPNNEVQCVILANTLERTYRPWAYNPDVMKPPACYAMGETPSALRPADVVPEPEHENCAECPKAEFVNNKAPECKTRAKLVLIPVSSSADATEVAEAAPVILRISPTSVKLWRDYMSTLADGGQTPWSVVTSIKLEPQVGKTYPKWVISAVRPLTGDDAVMGAIVSRLDKAEAEVIRGWTYEDASNDVDTSRYSG